MNEKIEQAIEQLRIRKEIKSQLCQEDCVEEALALLESCKAEPAAEPTLTWDKPLSSDQAVKYFLTNGFVAVELYRAQIKRLDAQQKENERLTSEIKELKERNANLWSVNNIFQKARNDAESALETEKEHSGTIGRANEALTKEIDRLTAENKAQAERIAELVTENEMRINDQVKSLKEAKRDCEQWSDISDKKDKRIEKLENFILDEPEATNVKGIAAMNEKIEQAIEQLRIRKEIKSQLCQEDCVEEALALLESCKAEPAAEPGEFTKHIRDILNSHALYEACCRKQIDRLTAENTKLKERIEKLEIALEEIKQIARTASRHEIFGIANEALGKEKT